MAEDEISRRELEARLDAIKEQLSAQKESVTIAMTAADRAVTKAETAAERRFESVNEFRATLADSARLLMPRLEVEQIVKSLEEKINGIQKLLWVGTGVILAFQFFLGVAMIFWKDKPGG
jgi:hypothetical protein